MLLPGKKLAVAELMGRYCIGGKSISRDFEVIGEELPIISKQGYNGGYFLMDSVGKNQNTLPQEQLEREYGVNRSTPSNWVKQLPPIKVPEDETVTLKEYKALQKENQRLKIGNEI